MFPKAFGTRKRQRLYDFWRNRRGNVALMAGLLFPILLLAGGMALDYGSANASSTRLQEMADAAAIAAAKELVLANAEQSQLQSVAQQSVDTNFNASPRDVLKSLSVTATANTSANTVTIELNAVHANVFGGILNPAQTPLKSRATAQALGGVKLCVLGLHPSANGAIRLEQNAQITANECAVYSNSSHNHAIKTKNSSSITAELICSVGGKDGASGSFSPTPLTDCPAVPDPLASRPAPSFGSCDENGLVINGASTTLTPGVYCGGILIEGNANVTLDAGVYIIKDGAFRIRDTATVSGEFTGFYFTGSGAELRFEEDTSIEFSAPKDGVMAGLLFFQDASTAGSTRQFRIDSNNARTLLGTIYLPKGEFYIDADAPVADQSAYTVIIAEQFRLYEGPNLVLNTDYADTEVPVPDGVLHHNATIALVK